MVEKVLAVEEGGKKAHLQVVRRLKGREKLATAEFDKDLAMLPDLEDIEGQVQIEDQVQSELAGTQCECSKLICGGIRTRD